MIERRLIRCSKCGVLNQREAMERGSRCYICKSREQTIVTYLDYEEEDKLLIIKSLQELEYILDFLVDKIKPSIEDKFGCIEMCDYIKKNYDLDKSVYELVGIINELFEHRIKNVRPYMRGEEVLLKDGRTLRYCVIEYNTGRLRRLHTTEVVPEIEITLTEENIKQSLINIIGIISKFKPYSTGRRYENGYYLGCDFDFSLQNMIEARENYLVYYEEMIQLEKEKKEGINYEYYSIVKRYDGKYVQKHISKKCFLELIKNDFYRIKITKENNIVFLKDEEQDKAYKKMDNDYERYDYQYYSNKSDLKKIAFIAEIIGVEKNEFIKFPRLAVSLNGSIYNSIKQKEKERFNSTLIKWTVIIIIAGLCMVIANSNSDRDNKWKQLSDEEKEWYERNYGDGQYEEINEAIDDYIDSLN